MTEDKWEVLDTIVGDLQAELLRGLLEAQNIPVYLSQEGAGRSVYHVVVGPLANVQILVPASYLEQAQKIMDEYYAGGFDVQDENESPSSD